MSAVNILSSKPQTFSSKIFRPWDESAPEIIEDKIRVEEVKKEVIDNSANSLSISNDPYLMHPFANGYYGAKPGVLPGVINPILSTDIYGLSPTKCVDLLQPSAVQFADPCGFNYMEVERILLEEARAKALSSRKQRPKKFKCPHCNAAFSNNGQCKAHIRIHTGTNCSILLNFQFHLL